MTPTRRPGAAGLVETAVVDAARRVFAEEGYDGASVDRIAAAAGLTKGAVYSRFATKEALFLRVMAERDRSVLRAIEGGTPAEWASSWRRLLEDDRQATALGTEFRLYGLRNPEARPHVRRWQRESHEALAEAVEALARAGGLRLRVPAPEAAAIVAAVATGLAQQWYADHDAPVERLLATTLELLIDRGVAGA